MKAEIHPALKKVKFVCSCGESGDYVCEAYSTIAKDIVKVEVCSYCHPFYTGKQRIVDTGGRVEKFMKKKKAAEEHDARTKHSEKPNSGKSQRLNSAGEAAINTRSEKIEEQPIKKEEISSKEALQEAEKSPPVQIELIEQPQGEKMAEVTAKEKKPIKKRAPRKKKTSE